MKLINKETFEKNLKFIAETGGKLQDTIHAAGVYALYCCNIGNTTGQDSPIQRLWDSLHNLKGINQQAFMSWAQEFGCLRFVKLEDGQFIVKHLDRTKKDPTFVPEQAVEMAESMPFWEFAKEPTPNTSPYDVQEHLRSILAQAKRAETGGTKGDKPKRQIEHREMLDIISFVLANPESARQRLGLLKLSEETKVAPVEEQDDESNNRQELKAA